mmetsp:Transcript_69182/g.174411  ORF Transcript_69182/g.174411 Transcript_69182/m.174411 type:complete len:200 (+) Transcript_69182:565-1164(+)
MPQLVDKTSKGLSKVVSVGGGLQRSPAACSFKLTEHQSLHRTPTQSLAQHRERGFDRLVWHWPQTADWHELLADAAQLVLERSDTLAPQPIPYLGFLHQPPELNNDLNIKIQGLPTIVPTAVHASQSIGEQLRRCIRILQVAQCPSQLSRRFAHSSLSQLSWQALVGPTQLAERLQRVCRHSQVGLKRSRGHRWKSNWT